MPDDSPKLIVARATKALESFCQSTDSVVVSPTGTAKCKECGETIPRNSLRIERLVPSPTAPGKQNSCKYHIFCMKSTPAMKKCIRTVKRDTSRNQELLVERSELVKDLKALRKSLQQTHRFTDYHYVFTDAMLNEVVLKLPQTKDELKSLHGFGEARWNCCGQEILDCIVAASPSMGRRGRRSSSSWTQAKIEQHISE